MQICIPGLHISLGIFYRLFSLLEDAVHCLDYQIAPLSSTAQQIPALEKYVDSLHRLAAAQEERVKAEDKAAMYEQVATLSVVNESESFTTTPQLVTAMLQEAAKLRQEIVDLVSTITLTSLIINHHLHYF